MSGYRGQSTDRKQTTSTTRAISTNKNIQPNQTRQSASNEQLAATAFDPITPQDTAKRAERYRPCSGRIGNPDRCKLPNSLILLGKTGAGKSTLGNFLLDGVSEDQKFEVSDGALSCTQKCQMNKTEFQSETWLVVDTPGFLDTTVKSEKDSENFKKEISKSLQVTTSGPNAFLIVMEFAKMTNEQRDAIQQIQCLFPEMMAFTIFVFIQKNRKEKELDKYIGSCQETEKNLFKNLAFRSITVNSEEEDPLKRGRYRTLVFGTISEMMKKNPTNHYKQTITTEVGSAVRDFRAKVNREPVGTWKTNATPRIVFDPKKAEATLDFIEFKSEPKKFLIDDDAVIPEVQQIVENHISEKIKHN